MEILKNNENDYEFIFDSATYTIGNLLQTELLKNQYVKFAGYHVPHPSETKMIVRLVTKDKNPKEILNNVYNKILNDVENIMNILEKSD